jgi:hypothetical protein
MDRFDVVAHFAKRRMGVPIDWKRFFDVPPANADEWEHGVTGDIGHLSNGVRWFVSRHEDPGRVLADTEVDAITWRMFSALFDEDTVKAAMDKDMSQAGYEAFCDEREEVEAKYPHLLQLFRKLFEGDEDMRTFVCCTLLLTVGFCREVG